MPQIVEYSIVLKNMQSRGLACVYHKSGAFAFADERGVEHVGWLGESDGTLKVHAREWTRLFDGGALIESTLIDLFLRAHQLARLGTIWLMPKSHWAHELQHGHREELADALSICGINPSELATRADGSAIQFAEDELELFRSFAKSLFKTIRFSDFTIAFPDRMALATLHHHRQIWWSTSDSEILRILRTIEP